MTTNPMGRGPKGSAIAREFDQSIPDLEILLRSAEFRTEYPLRYIEATRRDSLQHATEYEYRELMGDHPLVPLQKAQSTNAQLEARSLYLVDRKQHTPPDATAVAATGVPSLR